MKRLFIFFCTAIIGLYSYSSSYFMPHFIEHINKDEVKGILEIGGFDFEDTLIIEEYYKCPLIVFEPNIHKVKENIHKIENNPNIHLENKGVWKESGELDFYYCDIHPGSSSFYHFDYRTMARRNRKTIKETADHYPMTKVKVPVVRLDEYLESVGNPRIDLICMDAQGAALDVLKGLGDKLKEIKYIITEVEYERIYEGEALYSEIYRFMKANNFECYGGNIRPCGFFGDVLFMRRD